LSVLIKLFSISYNCLIANDSHQRVFSSTNGVEQILLGLYIVGGDNDALIDEIDEKLDNNIDFFRIRTDPLQAAKT
ncbi:unnamed protein product, partial [Rotaria sordida]